MTMIYFGGPLLDHDDTYPPAVIRGYDKTGNLLSTIIGDDRVIPTYNDYITDAPDYPGKEYYNRSFNWPVYIESGEESTYSVIERHLRTIGSTEIPVFSQDPEDFTITGWRAGKSFAVNQDGHIFAASFHLISRNPIPGNTSAISVSSGGYYKRVYFDFFRLYNRNGDRVEFPQLHGAGINDVKIGSGGNIHVCGYPNLTDNRYNVRKYDESGALIWSGATQSFGYDVVNGMALDASGNIYCWGWDTRNDSYDFIAKFSSGGALIWRASRNYKVHCVSIDASTGYVYASGLAKPGGETVPYVFQRISDLTGGIVDYWQAVDSFFTYHVYQFNVVIYDGNLHVVVKKDSTQSTNRRVYSLADYSLVSEDLIGLEGASHSAFNIDFYDFDYDTDDGAIYAAAMSSGADDYLSYHNFLARDLSGNRIWAWIDNDYDPPEYVNAEWMPQCVQIIHDTHHPALSFPIALADFTWIGDTYSTPTGLALPLLLSGPALRREYVGSLRLPDVYFVALSGATDLVLPTSSIQIRRNSASLTLSVVSPAATMEMIQAVDARSTGDLVLSRGVRFADGSAQIEEMLRVPLSGLRWDRGTSSGSLSLSGSVETAASFSRPRTLRGISYRNTSGGKRRIRCGIDTYLMPGDTAVVGGGETLTVAEITYSINPRSASMEVSE